MPGKVKKNYVPQFDSSYDEASGPPYLGYPALSESYLSQSESEMPCNNWLKFTSAQESNDIAALISLVESDELRTIPTYLL